MDSGFPFLRATSRLVQFFRAVVYRIGIRFILREIRVMQAIGFFLTYPFIYLIALLPFPLLYALSDVAYYLLRLSGYRKKVILKNLRNSFPEKSEPEIQAIADRFRRHLCDLLLETLKMKNITKDEVIERMVVHKSPRLEELRKQKRSVIMVLPHYANWEWAAPAFDLQTPYRLLVVYKALSNPWFDKMMRRIRTRHGTRITPTKNVLREIVASRNDTLAIALVADQAASKKDAYWTTFLHQDTAVFTGPEKLAKKFDLPIVFMKLSKLRRGHYQMDCEVLFEHPRETAEWEITETFTRRFEEQIREDPTVWLWSHKRWKHKRPASATPAA